MSEMRSRGSECRTDLASDSGLLLLRIPHRGLTQASGRPGGFSTFRSLISAVRIWVFTVPTGALRISAICS